MSLRRSYIPMFYQMYPPKKLKNLTYGDYLCFGKTQQNLSCFVPSIQSSFVNQLKNKYFSTDVQELVTTEDKKNKVLHNNSKDGELDALYRTVEVECRGAEPAVLRSYHKFVTAAAGHLQITIGSVEFPKYHHHRLTLLKSVFIYKKHRVQYEIRTHFLIMRFLRLTSSTTDTFLEYIQRNLPEGVSMKVTTEELCHLPKEVKASDLVAHQTES